MARSENGEAQASLSLSQLLYSGSGELPADPQSAESYLERSYFQRSQLLPDIGNEPAPEEALEHMLGELSAEPAKGDCLIPATFCLDCQDLPQPPICVFVGAGLYTTVEDLVGRALRASEAIASQYLPDCLYCSKKLSVLFVDFYSQRFHEEYFLAVRSLPSEGSLIPAFYGLLWWKAESEFLPIPKDIFNQESACNNALERAARLYLTGQDYLASLTIREAFRKFKGDPIFVHFASLLSQSEFIGLSERIARTHLESYPTDAIGHFFLAEALLRGYLAYPDSKDALSEARANIAHALSLRPVWKEAELLRAMIARANQTDLDSTTDPDSLNKLYRQLLTKYPTFVPALCEGALYFRGSDNTKSSELMKEALKLSPQEPALESLLK